MIWHVRGMVKFGLVSLMLSSVLLCVGGVASPGVPFVQV